MPDTSEPVVVLSFGSVGLVEKTVVGGIFTTSDSTAFHFPVPIAQIGIRIHFATAVVNVSTCLITSVRIGSGFYAAVVTGFPVILKIMLIIPAVPSGLYLAEGLVMTSTCLISSAGIISRMSAWLSAVSPDAFPLIQTVTLEFPR